MSHPVIAVELGKGGVAKTATSIALAEAAAEAGAPVLLIDSDPQGSLVRWSQLAEASGRPLRAHVAGVATRDLATRVPLMATGYGLVLIDGPPGHLDIVKAGIQAAHLVVMPVPPRPGDFDRVSALIKLCADAGTPLVAVQTFVRAGSASQITARETLVAAGVPVADAVLPTSEATARLYGVRPRGRLAAFGRDLLTEVLARLDQEG